MLHLGGLPLQERELVVRLVGVGEHFQADVVERPLARHPQPGLQFLHHPQQYVSRRSLVQLVDQQMKHAGEDALVVPKMVCVHPITHLIVN